jgi:hypothetical protein
MIYCTNPEEGQDRVLWGPGYHLMYINNKTLPCPSTGQPRAIYHIWGRENDTF